MGLPSLVAGGEARVSGAEKVRVILFLRFVRSPRAGRTHCAKVPYWGYCVLAVSTANEERGLRILNEAHAGPACRGEDGQCASLHAAECGSDACSCVPWWAGVNLRHSRH